MNWHCFYPSNHHKPMCWLSAAQKQSKLLTTLSDCEFGADVQSGQLFKRKLCSVQIQDFVIGLLLMQCDIIYPTTLVQNV